MSSRTGWKWLAHAGDLGLLAALLVMGGLFAYYVPGFATRQNLMQILINISVVGIVAVGEFFVILAGGIDISVGKVAAFAGIVTASLVAEWQFAPGIAAAAGLGVAIGIGLASGTIISWFRIPPFIVTLGVFSIVDGLMLTWSNGTSIGLGSATWLTLLGQGRFSGIVPVPVVVMLATFALGWLVASHTVFGRRLYAVGGNEEAARLAGVSVRVHRAATYVIASALAGLGGLVFMAQLNAGDPKSGQNLEFDAITAVVLGGTSLFGGEGNLPRVLVGAVFMGTLTTGLTQWNVNSYQQYIIKGAVLIAAVLLDTALRNRRLRSE